MACFSHDDDTPALASELRCRLLRPSDMGARRIDHRKPACLYLASDLRRHTMAANDDAALDGLIGILDSTDTPLGKLRHDLGIVNQRAKGDGARPFRRGIKRHVERALNPVACSRAFRTRHLHFDSFAAMISSGVCSGIA